MFHVEIRMGNMDVVRAFNLSEHDLEERFLAPLMADRDFELEGMTFEPRKARLTVLEGDELAGHQLAMGRGWSSAERASTDVTAQILERARAGGIRGSRPSAQSTALKERIVGRLSGGPVTLADVVRIAAGLMHGQRVSEQLAASELAAWELLHTGSATLELDGGEVSKDGWEALVLSPDAWLDGDAGARLAPGPVESSSQISPD